MFFANIQNGLHIKHIAQSMGYKNGFGFRGKGSLNLGSVDVIGAYFTIHKHRHQTLLDNGVYRGRETRRNRNYLIAFFKASVPQFVGSKRAERQQIGRRARIGGQRKGNPQVGGKIFLKLVIKTPGRKPHIQGGVYHTGQVIFV